MSNLIYAPEFQMSIDELAAELEKLAEKKEKLTMELLNLDTMIVYFTTITTLKAMKELGRA